MSLTEPSQTKPPNNKYLFNFQVFTPVSKGHFPGPIQCDLRAKRTGGGRKTATDTATIWASLGSLHKIGASTTNKTSSTAVRRAPGVEK